MFNSGAWDIGDFEGSDIASKIGFFWGPTFSDSQYEQQIGIKASGGVYVVSSKAAEDPALLDQRDHTGGLPLDGDTVLCNVKSQPGHTL